MTYYHETKDAALLSGVPYSHKFQTRVQLEPYNGWVLILKPKDASVFDEPLTPYLAFAELDLAAYSVLNRRPDTYKRPPPPPSKVVVAKDEPVVPTWKAGDDLPW